VWNLNEGLIQPEEFAQAFCQDLDLPTSPWVETVATQIRAQLEDHEGVASMDFDVLDPYSPGDEEVPECRVILSVCYTTSLLRAC
jgi:chromatin structure-remodeling complex subunit SFH1